MNFIRNFISFFLNLDKSLASIIQTYGMLVYPLLFMVIFCETGLVVTPFLPGDSLLFAVGALSATGAFNVWLIFLLLALAAFLGDTVNYWLGKTLGLGLINRWKVNPRHIERTQRFYERHGGKTIIIARFVPIIRTFAPFVAGIGKMKYFRFISYNIIGGVAWTASLIFAGYFFGNIPWVKKHFSVVIAAIIVISLIPVAIEYLRARRGKDTAG